ncbi:HNH endonuclease [Gimesia chilikensis]|nr:HNH endonuclease [Gimesia chilikensis]
MPDNEELELLRPTTFHRIYDLVASAGVNVEDWGNYKGGPSKASQNPKYCYEWSFDVPGKFSILCLWFDELECSNGSIFQKLNLQKEIQSFQDQKSKSDPMIRRAQRMDKHIVNAFERQLPIKVIICDGSRRDKDNPNSKASKVSGRKLDPIPWAVTTYDPSTGNCVITRNGATIKIFDQYSVPIDPVRKRVQQTETYIRDRAQRDAALHRACGNCEYCGMPGFETKSGYIYLETHHVVPLSEGGADHERNIVALCANDHRAAHYGKNQEEIRDKLKDLLSRYYT